MGGKLRWGVLGCGGIARRRTIPEGIVPAENAQLVAVFDVDADANREAAETFGARATGSQEELLALDLDAVYVATPVDRHYGQVLACVRAGKDVLCEKPLGRTVAQAEEMIAASEAAGVTLGTGFMMRFHAQHQAARKMIQDGELGSMVYGRAQLSCWYPPAKGAWRQDPARGGGGSLVDMGGHCIDLLEMFLGPVIRVTCFTGRIVQAYASEDGAVALLQFESGALGTVDAFFCTPDAGSRNVLELYGSRGSILARNTIGQTDCGEMVAFLEKGQGTYDGKQGARGGSGGVVIAPEPVNTYRAEISEFSAAVIGGRKPACDARIGLRNQQVVSACYESARTGRAVAV